MKLFFLLSGLLICGFCLADDQAKVIDLSLPPNPPAKVRRAGLHGGAADLLKQTKPIDSQMDDATREGQQKPGVENSRLQRQVAPFNSPSSSGVTIPNLNPPLINR